MSLNFKKVNIYSSTYNLLTREQIDALLLPVVVVIPEVPETPSVSTGTQVTSTGSQTQNSDITTLQEFADNFIENYELTTLVYDWQSRNQTTELRQAIYRAIELYNDTTDALRRKDQEDETYGYYRADVYPYISINFSNAKDTNDNSLSGIFVIYSDKSFKLTQSGENWSSDSYKDIKIGSISDLTSVSYVGSYNIPFSYIEEKNDISPTLETESVSYAAINGDNFKADGLLQRLQLLSDNLSDSTFLKYLELDVGDQNPQDFLDNLKIEINELTIVIENYKDITNSAAFGSRGGTTIKFVLDLLKNEPSSISTVTEVIRNDILNPTLRR